LPKCSCFEPLAPTGKKVTERRIIAKRTEAEASVLEMCRPHQEGYSSNAATRSELVPRAYNKMSL
jgi:hypothetical protein